MQGVSKKIRQGIFLKITYFFLTIQSFQQLCCFQKDRFFEFGLDLENKNGNEGRNMVTELLAIIKWSQAVLSGSS
jgi:hypothetical protein